MTFVNGIFLVNILIDFSTELAARSTNTSRWSCAMAEKDGRVGNRLSTIMNSGVLVERCCSRWLSSLPLDMAILLHALRGAKSLLFSTQSLGCHCFCCICRILVGFGQFDRCSWNCFLLVCSFCRRYYGEVFQMDLCQSVFMSHLSRSGQATSRSCQAKNTSTNQTTDIARWCMCEITIELDKNIQSRNKKLKIIFW